MNTRDFRTMSDEIVKMNTARTISEWYRIMDKFNASTKSKSRIATYLKDCYSLSGWWLEAIISRYEYDNNLTLKPIG